jgi:hypothetical protein
LNHLELSVVAGGTAGQRVRIEKAPAGFGRDPSNALVIDLPTISRFHGRFDYIDDRWVLINESANSVSVNGKLAGKKPRPMFHGDRIQIGGMDIMTIAMRAANEASPDREADEVEDEDLAAGPPKVSPRAKLWLGILGFWIVIFALAFIFFGGDQTRDNEGSAIPRLTDEQIASSIRAPLEKREPSPRNAVEWLERAELAYQTIAADPSNVFDAYQAYRTALSYAIGAGFNDSRDDWGGLDQFTRSNAQIKFSELQDRLIEQVQQRYKDAWGMLQARRYDSAQNAFKRVMDFYHDTDSLIYQNALRQRDAARRLGERN